MPYADLQSFALALERAGELKRIRVEVDPELEITEIATRVVRQGGPALLFERVKGSRYPLLINLFGSAKRVEMALGAPPADIGQELLALAQSATPPRWMGLWRSRKTLRKVLSMHTKHVRRAMSQEVSETPTCDEWPVLKCWPEDGGRFITFGLTLTEHPRTKVRNVGLYRLQVFSPTTTGMHWQIQKGGGFHYYEAEKRGQALPVAVILGADPCLLLAAIAPLPEGMDEVAFSGFLRRTPTPMVRGKTFKMEVPANAECILEGEVPLHERRVEGPFGDHFGHYSSAAPFPVFHAHQQTRRRQPIYLAAVVGKPPQEDKYLGDATQEIMGPVIKIIRPEVEALWAHYEAGFHNLLTVAVTQRYAKEAMKTGLGLLGEGQLSLTKCMVLVDAQTDVRDFSAVLTAILQNFDVEEDVLILPGVALDTLDFTSFTMNLGSRMILDATRKRTVKPVRRVAPSAETLQLVFDRDDRVTQWRFWNECLLVVRVRTEGRPLLEKLVQETALEGVKMIAVVSEDIDLDDPVSTLWGIFTRFDCARDVTFTRMRLVGPTVRYGGRLGIDATFKPGYPAPLTMPESVRAKVDQQWSEYGIE